MMNINKDVDGKRVLVAVLNWGLGHAVRCIPVIRALIEQDYKPVLAADGSALQLLKLEFPNLAYIEAPPLHITYASRGSQVVALCTQMAKLIDWYRKDAAFFAAHLTKNTYCGIISDNRPGCFSSTIPSVYITHQLRVGQGFTGWVATKIHGQLFKKYRQVWVPDIAEMPGLSGTLAHGLKLKNLQFIGPLSDLKPTITPPTYDVACILSGPEPQRSLFECTLIAQLKNADLNVLFLRGTRQTQPKEIPPHWEVHNVANRTTVQRAFAVSRAIIARSGYTTLMDITACPKPALLVPTPGQPEQEYLASLPLHRARFAIKTQKELDVLAGITEAFEKFKPSDFARPATDWKNLFGLFEGK